MSVDQENPNLQSSSEDELPDWLKEIRGEAPASDAKKTTSPAAGTPKDSVADIEELPAWLQDVPEEVEASLEADVVQSAVEGESPEADGVAMFKQILEEEGLSLDDVPEERPEEAQDMSVADYMEATADASAKRQAQADRQPQTTSKSAEPEPPAEEPVVAAVEDDGLVIDDELPDWLKDEGETETDTEPAAWLADESLAPDATVQETETAADAVDTDTEAAPEWLQSETAESAEPAAKLEDDGMVIADELPDWLKDDGISDADTAPETPSWMSDESIITSAEEVRAAVEPSVEPTTEEPETNELPDWLQEDAEVESEVASEVPAWLVDETTSEEPVAEVETVETSVDEPELHMEDTQAEEELPDWLKEDTEIEPELETETPSWLVDETVVDAEETVEFTAEVEAVDDEMIEDEELPDWLKAEVASEDDESAEWLTEEVADEPTADVETDEFLDETDLPDWLQEGEEMWSEATTESVEAETATTAAIDAEAPEWLTEEPTEAPESDVQPEVVVAEAEVVEEPVVEEAPVEEPVAAVETSSTMDAFATAKQALEVGQLNDALETFNSLIAESTQLNEIVSALSEHLNVFSDNPAIYESLGDAQTRLGQLNQAFQSYKTALQKL